MSFQHNVLLATQQINQELKEAGFSKNEPVKPVICKIESHCIYDEIITNKSLRRKTEKLFKDGHHSRAVEEAFKLLDNLVKKKSELQNTDITGASLMQKVFSPNKPKLKLNSGVTSSEQNEQLGYMQIFAGCMTGIRNPRAHDSDWEDTEDRALQLLMLANHLIERAQMAERTE